MRKSAVQVKKNRPAIGTAIAQLGLCQFARYFGVLGCRMANLVYKGHLLICFAFRDESNGFWISNADISWTQDGCKHVHKIACANSQFPKREDAESFALETAKAWVDSLSYLPYGIAPGTEPA
jgi:hypothetical protein